MNCDWVKSNITLYAFEELADADRAELEQHLVRCGDCSREAAAEKELRRLMDLRPKYEPSAALLAQCRMDLAAVIEDLPAPAVSDGPAHKWRLDWKTWLAAPFAGLQLQWQAGIAVALLSVGFFSGTFAASRGGLSVGTGNGSEASLANIAGVHSISTRPDGKLEISLDTLHRQTIQGSLDDPRVRQVLVSALGDYNSGVRLDSLDQMKRAIDGGKASALVNDPQVRAGLIASLRGDKNPGVRLKTLEALKGFESDPAVREALLAALVSDTNAGVRIAAVEMLSARHDAAPDTAAIAALQRLAAADANSYVRLKSADTLRKWNAPVEIY